MITPMPIFIPISGGSGGATSNYTFPSWVIGTAKIGTVITVLGFTAFLICALIYLITDDDRFDPLEKPAIYTFAACIGGLVIMLIALVLMLFTGTQTTE